ncbi:disease resistance protein RPV1-like [Jatropha curcas]|uniref:disease resistance protein RPV1-like n=1 Tax=Jatropha curcas TaxID=180498 RepID=UPI0018962B44|nr:disease resistance protein RPV1-like [Jatropha curcas]
MHINRLPNSICKLQSLQTLLLGDCYGLEELPKNMELINLRCLWITTKQRYLPVGGIGCLKSLQYLFITDCDNLESLCEDIQGLKRLQTLVIRDCDSLVCLPPSVRFLASLKTLVIADCRSLSLTMKEDSASQFSLRELKIGGLSKLVDFPEWLLRGSTNSLKVIEVVSCHSLRDLPDYIQNIQSLEEFHIKGYKKQVRMLEFQTSC